MYNVQCNVFALSLQNYLENNQCLGHDSLIKDENFCTRALLLWNKLETYSMECDDFSSQFLMFMYARIRLRKPTYFYTKK